MLEQFNFAFGITGPILLLLLLGWVIRQLRLIDHQFVAQANALVFNVALPTILFLRYRVNRSQSRWTGH